MEWPFQAIVRRRRLNREKKERKTRREIDERLRQQRVFTRRQVVDSVFETDVKRHFEPGRPIPCKIVLEYVHMSLFYGNGEIVTVPFSAKLEWFIACRNAQGHLEKDDLNELEYLAEKINAMVQSEYHLRPIVRETDTRSKTGHSERLWAQYYLEMH